MRLVFCTVVLLCIPGLGVAYGPDQGEPKAGGKTISQWIEVLKTSPQPTARAGAAATLGDFGPKAKAAVPALIETLKKDTGMVRYYATDALGHIGAPAVPALERAVKDKSPKLRAAAATALARVRPTPKGTVPLLISLLENDKSAAVRAAAAGGLGPLGKEAKPAVEPLLHALKDKNAHVRDQAGSSLKQIDLGAARRACVK